MVKKNLIFILLILSFLPLVYAVNYGEGAYGCGLYDVGCSVSPTPTPPAPVSPGGGGGAPSCTYDWQCTAWFPSICPESGIQERICANKGTCIGTVGMPDQTRTCEYLGPAGPLFDIFLTLSDKYKEICPRNKIKANVNLENYGRIELLDAFMTYWIVDENNTLIVELKDTRAVEKETNFNIEIKIPESTPEGTYRLYAEITYSGNKTAVAGDSFKVMSPEECKLYPWFNFEMLFIYMGIGIITLLFIIILIILFRRRKSKTKKRKTNKEYKKKIKENLKRIKSKTFLIIITSLILIGVLFIGGKGMTGFVIRNANAVNNNWNIFGFVLIIGMLGLLAFIYKEKIVEKIEIKRRNKHSKNSLKRLIKKKVYITEGDFIGKVDEVILGENKIHSLKIKLDKKRKFKVKGIIVKYKNVESIGHIVIVDKKILEKLNI